ncbi:MAG: hypothetical protein MUC99_13430 [Anaerolineae bacterium]|nr:hypothetical protein [Anaerolineae bacterium]
MSTKPAFLWVIMLAIFTLGIVALPSIDAQNTSAQANEQSAQRNSTLLIQNGSFETAGSDSSGAANWQGTNLLSTDVRVCGPGLSSYESCSFRFRNTGLTNTFRRIRQTINTPFGRAGDFLTVGYNIRIAALTNGTTVSASFTVNYVNTALPPEVFSRSYSVVNGSFASESEILRLDGRVRSVVVVFRVNTPGLGRIFIDNVSVEHARELFTPSLTPSPYMTNTPTPTRTPSLTPPPVISETPSLTPTEEITNTPTQTNTPGPTETPSPTDEPTTTPTQTLTP